MSILRRLFHPGPAEAERLRTADADAAIRALESRSPEVVTAAAYRLLWLHRSADAAADQGLAVAGPVLVHAFERTRLLHFGERREGAREALIALSKAIAEFRVPEAEQLLQALRDSGDDGLRLEAAEALAQVPPHGRADVFRAFFEAPGSTVAAAGHLLELGDEGVSILRSYALEDDARFSSSVTKALEELARYRSWDPAFPANQILGEVARREAERREAGERAVQEEARWQAEQREAWERYLVRQRAEAFPLAARLAALLGHPEWIAGSHVIKPPTEGEYDEAVASCRAHRLNAVEQEKLLKVDRVMGTHGYDEPDETVIRTVEVSAGVEFEGESFVILGGKRERQSFI